MKPILLSIALLATTCFHAQQPKIMESFEEGIPHNMSVRGGKLSIDSKRTKHQKNALKWDWVANDALVFHRSIGYRQQQPVYQLEASAVSNEHSNKNNKTVLTEPRGFFMWIYNEKPTTQRLIFQFGRDAGVDCEFDFNLNFKGWRTIWIHYDRGDMRGVPHPDMNRMTILAPAIGSGSYYIDAMGLSLPMNPKTTNPNMQMPYINHHPRLVARYAESIFDHHKLKPSFPLEDLDEKTSKALDKMTARAEAFYLPPHIITSLAKKGINDIIEHFAKFRIYREGDRIFGAPLIKANLYKEYFKELGLGDEILNGCVTWKNDFSKILLDIALRYNSIENKEQKNNLEQMFIDLFDYGVDQGFDVGATLGWIHHYSYVIREYGTAMFLMRNLLIERNKLGKAHEIMKWFYRFNQVYEEDELYGVKGRKAANADDLQGLLPSRLLCALILENSPEKVRDLKHFSFYFSNITTAYANALDETYKPDGTTFHHAGQALGYGSRAIYGGVSVMYLLGDSPFQVSKAGYQRMKKVTKTFFDCMFTSQQLGPRAFASIRFQNFKIPKYFYSVPALVALSRFQFDDEMAGLYEQLLKDKGNKTTEEKYWLNRLEEKGKPIKYEYAPMRILPYSAIAMHRNDNEWMITARGFSKYVYGYESWGRSFFAYPTFLPFGYLDVSYPNDLDSTAPKEENQTWLQGYDWHHWPGVTSVNVPYKQIITNPGQYKDEGGEYAFSDQGFVGGVQTQEGYGVFVLPFKGMDKFKLQTFTGKKSYFFFDDMVVCLGSNIKNEIGNYNVETTLFQNQIDTTRDKLITNKEEITTFPYRKTIANPKPLWLIDKRNTGYYIPNSPNNGSLSIMRTQQTNPDFTGEKTVKGNFSKAIFSHGIKPKNASYEYVVIADADKNKMNKFLSEMQEKNKPYKIIQQNEKAHIVASHKLNATAYAIFDETVKLKEGLITDINRPATFIVEQVEGQVRLAVSDPDLNIYDGQDDRMPDGTRVELSIYSHEWYFWPSRVTKVLITIKGKWNIKQQIKEMETAVEKKAIIVSSNEKETVIEFECRDGLSAEILLEKK